MKRFTRNRTTHIGSLLFALVLLSACAGPTSNAPFAEPALAARTPSTTGSSSALNPSRVVVPEVGSVSTTPREEAEWQYRRAVEFEKGSAGQQDYEKAVKWYRKASAQGHRDALYNLGRMYVDGRGVRKNNGEGVIYFRQAAELQHPEAHFNMGFMQENGRGVAKSPSRGLTSYIIASNLGVGKTAINARDNVAARLSRAQVSEAKRRARAWMDAHQL